MKGIGREPLHAIILLLTILSNQYWSFYYN